MVDTSTLMLVYYKERENVCYYIGFLSFDDPSDDYEDWRSHLEEIFHYFDLISVQGVFILDLSKVEELILEVNPINYVQISLSCNVFIISTLNTF